MCCSVWLQSLYSAPSLIVPNLNLSIYLCAGERPFKCESCNYLAANQHEVTRHARQVHNGPKPLSCPYCDYKTADRSNYKKHVELHLNPRQFLCPLCKYAASKKCNLQYHIKSRHAGCDVAMDISKVKLRVKKAGPNGAEENSSVHKLSNTQEDFDVDRDNRDRGMDTNPINLSIRRSSRPGISQSVQSDAPDKVQEKISRSDRELKKVKEQEKRITTRQKVKRAHEKVPKDEIHPGSTTANKTVDGKAKTKVRKLQAEKAAVENPTEEQTQTLKPDRQSEDTRKLRPDKENQTSESSRKKKKKGGLNKSRKSGSHQSEKPSKHADNSQQNVGGFEHTRAKKVAKEKAPKRKSAEAPDLNKSLFDLPPKTRRIKGVEKLNPIPEDPVKMGDDMSNGSITTKKFPFKNVSVKEDNLSVNSHRKVSGEAAQTHGSTENTNTEPNSSAQEESTGTSGVEEPGAAQDSSSHPIKPQPSLDTSPKQACMTDPKNTVEKAPNPSSPLAPAQPPNRPSSPAVPVVPADTVNRPAQMMEDSSLGEDTSDLMLSKPTTPPTLLLPVHLSKPTDPEDDEGIHSSHEGGSEISDSASEGSEDSGLNSNGSSAKLANDPETPTEEIPTPTELKRHMCIFCDRSFPLEAVYRRHLNRHLVNVYYMDNTVAGQK